MSTNADNLYEYGYTHEGRVDKYGAYVPIEREFEPAWHDSREKAETACANDLRFRVPTFVIRRPKPAQPERIGEATVKIYED